MRRRILNVILVIVEAGLLFAAPQKEAESGSQLENEGVQALGARDFARAVEVFTRLAKSDPTAKNVGYLAVAESGAGDLRQAIADFERSIQLGNDTTLTRYGLGTTYLRDNQPEAAVRELEVVIARDPSYMAARYALGAALLNAGRAREAIPYLDAARQKTPGNPQVWISLIRAQFEAGEPAAALRLTDQALESIPDSAPFEESLAELCLEHRQAQKARSLLESAMELRPDDSKLKLLFARVSIETGNPGEALAALEGLPAGSGKPGEVPLLRGEAHALAGDRVTHHIV